MCNNSDINGDGAVDPNEQATKSQWKDDTIQFRSGQLCSVHEQLFIMKRTSNIKTSQNNKQLFLIESKTNISKLLIIMCQNNILYLISTFIYVTIYLKKLKRIVFHTLIVILVETKNVL